MKLWQKNYLVTAALVTAVLFVCAGILISLSLRMSLNGMRDAAITEEKAVASALDSMVLHQEYDKVAILGGIAQQYAENGVYLFIRQGETIYADRRPFAADAAEGTLQWFAESGRTYVAIEDAFAGGYAMTYLKDVTSDTRDIALRSVFAVVATLVLSLLVNGILYQLMLRINQPLSRLSHELRTPLTVIRGYGELLQIAVLTEEQRHNAASYIVDECDRLRDIISKILMMNDRGRIERERVSLAWMQKRLAMTWPDVTIQTEGDALWGDSTLLISLLDNLIGNAKKAGGQVTVSLSPKLLSVSDTGSGMDAAMLAYVNDPARTPRPDGIASGFGVPLCHEIARLHKATLTYTSAEGTGTTATIRFYNSDTTL